MADAGKPLRMISRRQLARPAVVFNFLDQRILTPPVLVARAETRFSVRAVSIFSRKAEARSCFSLSKILRAIVSARACFVGDFDGLFLGERGVRLSESLSSDRMIGHLRAVLGVLTGE